MSRLAHLFLITALGLFDFASAHADDTTCETPANEQTYIHKGHFADTGIGARTWNLLVLARASKAGDACAQTLYVRALKESQDYWDHVNQVHECQIAADLSKPPTPPATCSQKQSDAVLASYHWLRFVKTGYPPPAATGLQATAGCADCVKPAGGAPLTTAASQTVQDSAAALAAVTHGADQNEAVGATGNVDAKGSPIPAVSNSPAPVTQIPDAKTCANVAAADMRAAGTADDIKATAADGTSSVLSCITAARVQLLANLSAADGAAYMAQKMPQVTFPLASMLVTLKLDKHDEFVANMDLKNFNADKTNYPDLLCYGNAKKAEIICKDLHEHPEDFFNKLDAKFWGTPADSADGAVPPPPPPPKAPKAPKAPKPPPAAKPAPGGFADGQVDIGERPLSPTEIAATQAAQNYTPVLTLFQRYGYGFNYITSDEKNALAKMNAYEAMIRKLPPTNWKSYCTTQVTAKLTSYKSIVTKHSTAHLLGDPAGDAYTDLTEFAEACMYVNHENGK